MPGEGGVVTTLARLVEVLGRSVLEVRGAPGGLEIKLREPVVFDLADPPPIAAGDLVLGTGLGPDDAAELLPILAGRGAAALVVEAPVAGAVGVASVRAGVAVGAGSSARRAARRPVRHRRRGSYPVRWSGDHRGPPVTAARVLRQPEQTP